MKYKLLRFSLLSALAIIFSGVAVGALMSSGDSEVETYDYQELCMALGQGGPWTVNDGGDAGFTVGDATMHYLGDYTEQGFEWNQRFAYEYNERGKFTMRNKSNKKDGNCGMFSWDYAHKFSILGLKNGDKVTITIGTGTVTFVSTNVEGDVEVGAAVVSNQTYTISTTEETTRLDIEMAKASLIAKITIAPAGAEIVPSISLDKSALNLEPGETATVNATVEPSAPVKWKSSNDAVATVENGKITAVAVGEAKITCYWESEVSDKTVEASTNVTVAEAFVIEGQIVKTYDFTTMGDVTLATGEKAGSIYNAANSKNNDVFYCTNEGLEKIAIQAVLSGNKGWSIVDGKGLYEGSGAGRCAAVAGIEEGQIVEFFYTGSTFDTKSDGSDDGIAKTELFKKDGRIVFKADASGMIGFELTKGNYIEKINIYNSGEEADGFKDFSVIVNNQEGTLLTAEEQVQGTNVNFGVAVANDGTVSRVAADDASAVATVSGTYHSDHGCTGLKVVVPVTGKVKISVGQCTYSGNDIKVTNSAGEVVVQKTPATACWKNDRSNVTELYYVGEPTTLTISGMGYCPFVAVEATDYVPTKYAISYSLGNETAEGVVPDGDEVDGGEEYTIAKNFTLYKEGYTLTGWTDGTNTYATGESITPESDLALTPVFTENTVSLADRTAAVDLNFTFRRDQGAPTVGYEGKTGIWVTQAVVNDQTIDVKADFDTNNGGKFANGNWTDWAQMNSGTKWTVPSCKGATVTIEAYSAPTTTTIDGQTDYETNGTTISKVIGGNAETIDVIIGDGSYYRYININLPVVQSAGGQKFDNVNGSVTWNVGNEANGTATADITGAFSNVTVSAGSDLEVKTATYFDQTMTEYRPTVSNAGIVEGVMIEYRVKPKAGVTFQPTNVSFDAVKVGTDGAYFSYSYTTDGTESDVTAVAASTILRNNNANAATAQLNHSVNITADAANEFTFRFYISNTANDKRIALSNIVITGVVNGTVADVAQYTLTAVANPEEGGSVNIYPNGGIYEEGSTIKLTATKNFGYKFINWTNKAGEEVSKDAVYTFDIMADEEMTANFQKLNTYELAVNVEGGANDYMVSLNPQPTMVDGKKMYEEGTQVTLTAASNTILTFANWTGDSNETAGEIKIDMNADHAVTANYAAIDYIVGWDFYKSGNSGRPADFASTADNESTTLILVDENGNTQGWLDKSTVAAGGYENFAGAAVNWKDLGKYHFQTKINAKDFTNIKIMSQLLCNYNVYKHLTLDWSIDGETWHTINEMTFEATKTVYDLNAELPQETDHAEALYIRWMPDLTSGTIGTESGNDGTALSNIYILADATVYDDGKNPALVSTVPENNAKGASATGKIVLNFSEKVQLAEGATATLGDKTLTGAVSNKTITFAYTGLDYATSYTFKLSKAAVTDLFGNNPDADITLNFTTMERPTVTKALYDVEVSTAEELLAALTSASGSQRYRIFLHNGTYDLGTKCLTNVKSNISLIGESMEGTTIVNHPEAEGIGVTATLQVGGSNVYMQDITLKNAWDYTGTTGRAVCLQDRGDKNIYKNVRQLSFQDTYYSNNSNGRFYFEDGEIHGTVDFLCGGGDVYFNRVNLVIENRSGNVIAAPNGQKKYGYVFLDCEINPVNDAAYDVVNGTYRLGRPWGANCRAQYINTKMNILPAADGWGEMGGNKPEVFAEYNSVDKNGNLIDLSTRKLTFDGGTQASAILTEEQVAELSIENVMGSTDNWQPTLLTEQAPTPKNVKLEGTTLTWDDSQYALLWAVCKNSEVVAFTIEPTYIVDDTEAEYSVRAANEMGGLSEAAKVGDGTGIGNAPTVSSTENAPIYNLAGQRLQKLQKGINIVGGKKIIVK